MKNLFFFVVFYFSFATASGAGVDASRISQLNDAEKTVMESHATSKVTSQEIASAYERIFPKKLRDQILESSHRDSLLELFEAADIAEFYTGDPVYADQMRDAFDSLEKIGARPNPIRMYEAYISSEQFSEARKLLNRYPAFHAASSPVVAGRVTSGNGRKVWAINFSNNEMRQRSFEFNRGFHIIVMFQPLCHFSEDAAKAMESDRTIAELTRGRISWLVRVDRHFAISTMKNWNGRHEKFPVLIASDIKNWPEIDSWASPGFYFFYDGVLVQTLRGWPSDSRKSDIIDLIKRYGK